MKGRRIPGLICLQIAVEDKRAVVVPRSLCWRKPRPAAVLIHQPGAVLIKLFGLGMFIYEKEGKVIDAELKPKESEESNGKE